MNLSTRVKLAAYLTTSVYSVAFILYGVTLPSNLTRALSFVPTLVLALFALLDNVLWRVGPMPSFLRQPVLRGTWHGTLISYRRDATDRRIKSNHEVFLVIRQSLTTVSVTLLTEQSKSRSAVAQIVRMQADDYVLHYQYQNGPQLRFRQAGSTAHAGGSAIEVGGSRPTHLSGEYWTARETSGSFELEFVSERRATTFKEGHELVAGRGT